MVLVSIPSSNYSAQRRTFESPTLDPSVTKIRVTLTRENWPGDPATPLATMGFEVSLDGVNYPPISGASMVIYGGTRLGRDGVTPLTEEYVGVDIPGVGLTTRKVRATVENNQTMRTAIKVEAF